MSYRISLVSVWMAMGFLSFAIKGMNSQEEIAQRGPLTFLINESRNGEQEEATNSPLATALVEAATQGYDEVVRSLLEVPCTVQAFFSAVENGQLEFLNELLEKPIRLDARNDKDTTALTTAIENGHKECLRALLLAEVHLVIRGTNCTFRAPSYDKVALSRRRLKVALLGLRYAGADTGDPKLINTAGDQIVSSDYIRAWFLLSHRELREDVFIVFLNLLAKRKEVTYTLFRLAQNDLGDYLVNKLKDILKEIKRLQSFELDIWYLPANKKAEIERLLDPDLVEENFFGERIRNGIKAKINELLRTGLSQERALSESSSSSQSSSSVKDQSSTSSR